MYNNTAEADEIYRNSDTDDTTGLLTLKSFRTAADRIIEEKSGCYAVVYINLAGLKEYNAIHGFDAGTVLLAKVAAVLRRDAGGRIGCRYAGDHFAFLVSEEEVDEYLSAIKKDTDVLFKGVNTSVKAGICRCPEEKVDVTEVMDRAKIAADSIRHQEDFYRVYDEKLDEKVNLDAYILSHIDEAVEKGWIAVWYQPVVRTLTSKICGVEALSRWIDPEYGLLSPGSFVPVLEAHHQIHKLDLCILKKVCHDLYTVRREKISPVPVSINVSRLDFELCDIHNEIEKAVEKYELPKDLVHIEITESALMQDDGRIAKEIDRFHEEGFKAWMDDFGSGYSSLNALQRYDFDTLKIDMQFLRNTNRKTPSILISMVDMAKRLNIHTVSEGVETKKQFDFMKSIGCEKVQGYYISKPVPFDDLVRVPAGLNAGWESPAERVFADKLGQVNFLSSTPFNEEADENRLDIVDFAMGLVVYENGRFRILNINRKLKEILELLGIRIDEKGYGYILEEEPSLYQRFRNSVATVHSGKPVSLDLFHEGHFIHMHADLAAATEMKTAFVLTASDLVEKPAEDAHKLDDTARAVYKLFDIVNIINIGNNTIEHTFQADVTDAYNQESASDGIREFTMNEVYPEDQKRYAEFMDLNTMEERLAASSSQTLESFFRVEGPGGGWTWYQVFLYFLNREERKILVAFRRSDTKIIPVLAEAGRNSERRVFLPSGEMEPAELFETFTDMTGNGIFWKDAQRRFVGANQVFLNYYGFDSVDEIIGKTDEDMGWHPDPEHFKDDEERVLKDGIPTREIPGTCIVRGQVRKIMASKAPVYRDGRIIGLAGYFHDVTNELALKESEEKIARTDDATGLLNSSGLIHSWSDLFAVYQSRQVDFSMTLLRIRHFREFNAQYGRHTGDQLLKKVAECIRKASDRNCIAGHLGGGLFMMMEQCTEHTLMKPEELIEKIRKELRQVKTVGDVPVTVYTGSSCAYMHEAEDYEQLLSLAEKRLYERKE
jgi:diguanylate cyclase (GGDEF)-like protein